MGGLDINQMLAEIASEVRDKTGGEAGQIIVEKTGKQGEQPAGDRNGGGAGEAKEDRSVRQQILKEIIRDLHEGVPMPELKQRFHELIKDIDPAEIAAMEQALIDEGMPETEVKRLCDVHVEVFKESLARKAAVTAPPGHPVHTFMLENRHAEEIISEISGILAKIRTPDESAEFKRQRQLLETLVAQLADINLHYLRKENQLFPWLEKHDIAGPSQVMWALHDDIREALKTALTELTAAHPADSLNTIKYAIQSISDMIYKEEHILFPMAMETLTESDWLQVKEGEIEIGYAWVLPETEWPRATAASGPATAAVEATSGAAPSGKEAAPAPDTYELATGRLTLEQIDLILRRLPVEISFVDENDEVRYYSQVKEKIFPRSPGVIGRRVQNCHPAASLDKVQRVLDEFRSGRRNVTDFWIERKGRFIYIRYFAVRGADGTYKGTLEVVQDATEIRGLTGQHRLLELD